MIELLQNITIICDIGIICCCIGICYVNIKIWKNFNKKE